MVPKSKTGGEAESAQAPQTGRQADRREGRGTGWARAVGWARWLGDGEGAWAPAPALPLSAGPGGLGQAPCPLRPAPSYLYMKLLGNTVSTQDVASEPHSS